jgi:uncharacterized protein (DUF1786 family)
MTNPQENNRDYRELITRLADFEYRLKKVETAQKQLEDTMTPGGYITEAFERMYTEIDDFKSEATTELRSMNEKIAIILRHITGEGNKPDDS